MIILHISDIAIKEGNGVVTAVNQYLKFESLHNKVALYSLNISIGNKEVVEYNYKDYKSISSLPEPFNKPDIVVFNEVYKKRYIKISNECIKNNIKYVIIPHGCLTDTARKKKGSRIKKLIALCFALNKFIKHASAIQFLNKTEQENTHIDYRRSIISGNGIDLKECTKNQCKNKTIIYIGRFDIYHKGLDFIVNMCRKYHKWFLENGIVIRLYGRDSKGNASILRKQIDEYLLNDILFLENAVYGEEKKKILKDAYVFIQTSRFEGQPMGILEALGFGIPCVVTTGTTFSEYVNENNCGLGSDSNIDNIFNNLKKIINNDKIRNEMSKNAALCAKRDFDWNVVAKSCVEKYHEILADEGVKK